MRPGGYVYEAYASHFFVCFYAARKPENVTIVATQQRYSTLRKILCVEMLLCQTFSLVVSARMCEISGFCGSGTWIWHARHAGRSHLSTNIVDVDEDVTLVVWARANLTELRAGSVGWGLGVIHRKHGGLPLKMWLFRRGQDRLA